MTFLYIYIFLIAAPNISNVLQNGPLHTHGGENITINGSNFVPDIGVNDLPAWLNTTVLLHGDEISQECDNITWTNVVMITCLTPPGLFHNLTVIVGNQISNFWTLQYEGIFCSLFILILILIYYLLFYYFCFCAY